MNVQATVVNTPAILEQRGQKRAIIEDPTQSKVQDLSLYDRIFQPQIEHIENQVFSSDTSSKGQKRSFESQEAKPTRQKVIEPEQTEKSIFSMIETAQGVKRSSHFPVSVKKRRKIKIEIPQNILRDLTNKSFKPRSNSPMAGLSNMFQGLSLFR